MEPISPLFVGYPGRMLLVSGLFFLGFLIVRQWRGGVVDVRDWVLLIPSAIWGLAALWEYSVVYSSPETTNRFDWFLIAPLLILTTLLGIMLTFRPESDSA